jgi:hypothetical protein
MWLVIHTQQQNPHIILTLLLQHGSISKLDRNLRTKSANLNIKTSGAPIRQHVFFSRQNTFKIPKNIMHGLPHNHSKNPRHVHPFPCVGPYRNTCNKSKFFPDILSTSEVFSSRFFSFSPFDQVLLIPIYNTLKSKSNHTFLVLFKSLAT